MARFLMFPAIWLQARSVHLLIIESSIGLTDIGRGRNTSIKIDLASFPFRLVAETSIHELPLREASPPSARLARPIRVEHLHKSCCCLLTRLDQVLSQSV